MTFWLTVGALFLIIMAYPLQSTGMLGCGGIILTGVIVTSVEKWIRRRG